ncbi:MAG: SAF domain-containing protein [Planctomycetota bacterium]|nr:SAF domain-containing protein [Planctomycetota bacterium]
MRLIGSHQPCLLLADGADPQAAADAGFDGAVLPAAGFNAAACVLLGLLAVADVESPDAIPASADLLLLRGGEITNRPLIEACAVSGVPLLLGTAGSTLREVTRAVGWFQLAFRKALPAAPSRRRVGLDGGGSLVLLHGPDGPLRAMARMAEQTLTPVGYELEGEPATGALAVAVGACVLLAHGDGAALVAAVREAEKLLGEPRKQPTPQEVEAATRSRRSIVAARDLQAGSQLAAEDLAFLPPGGGLGPHETDKVIGRSLTRDVGQGQRIQVDDLDGELPEPPPWFGPRPPREKPSN